MYISRRKGISINSSWGINMETGFYWIGVIFTTYAFWWFVLRHISHALSEAVSAGVRFARLDFNDPDTVNIEVSKHFSSWDKLWLVPRRFRIVFVRELIDHWKYY